VTISAEQVLAGFTEGVSAIDAMVDTGAEVVPELVLVKPWIDGLNAVLKQVAAIAASNATLAAKLEASAMAVVNATASAEENAKFGPKP
jgi:hypothetical protein